MNSHTIAQAMFRRLRSPVTWGAGVAFEAVWVVTRRISGVPLDQIGRWELFVPALFIFGHIVLAPAPWQWSGDRRTGPTPGWGALQALLWNAAWVVLLLWGVKDLVKPERPAPRPSERAESAGRPAQPPPPPSERASGPDALPPGLPQELNLLMLNLPFALVLGWFLAGKEAAEAREGEFMEKERLARALALQSQLHPHALYNVLGGLAELVHEDPDATEKGIIDLVGLLRMLTRNGSAASLPLAQERALLRRYLAIEALRLGDRLQVRWNWPEWADAVELPPLLLQPLVENAVKHGIATSPGGGELCIGVWRQGQELLLQVANTGTALDPRAPEGTGLSNLRERLALLSQLGGRLVIREVEGRTLAEIFLRTNLST